MVKTMHWGGLAAEEFVLPSKGNEPSYERQTNNRRT